MLNIPAKYERDISAAKLTAISRHVFPDMQGVSACIFRRALVAESEMTRTQMGTQNRSEKGHIAWDALYDTTQ
jgi:hypothetical protein